jgi:oxygen-independent coproporphyrinogen-3 oxidase
VTANDSDEGLAIYVHWPFCRSKCPYCDFNSHVRENVEEARWSQALTTEIAYTAAQLRSPPRRVTSVFFGGGTPSLMPPSVVAAVIDAIARGFTLADDVEITLEANPTSVEAGSFRGFREAGVNRLSLGVQALNDTDLRALGREHSAAEALAALDTALTVFSRASFDLIYARPGQTLAAWRGELRQALKLAHGRHISLYQLTFEPGTSFFQARLRGAIQPLADDVSEDMFDLTQDMCDAAGLPAYEISNHAAPGQECRHNLAYWRYGEYAGIGPGAHGRLRRQGALCAIQGHRSPEKWLAAVETKGHGGEPPAPLAVLDRVEEALLMGLRLREGIGADRFEAATGVSLGRCLPPSALQDLTDEGYLVLSGDGLRATAKGRAVLDSVLVQLAERLQLPAEVRAVS